VDALPERLRHVVVGYFFEDCPMEELADELGVTESRISQLRAEAFERIREAPDSQLDPETFDRANSHRCHRAGAARIRGRRRGVRRASAPEHRPRRSARR
jgi:RNA polymerase sigma factor for flagellar operon FliA